ncbi:hypothetical protein [Curtobacterium sp. VKM Ac-1395]|uniref:hypothetical protein n=1 Tax=Curtobacterium sp. VKM Ac-1395 TaxID=2783815 RepID=UPI001889E8AB|nr:hypothetical protein [Curtobacterium sp. VKM Ac-1395]MBF4592032.1 hypothetical protein [Curtobacterium sp. VKM Ac-1395]
MSSNPYQSNAQQAAPTAAPRFVTIAFWLYLITALAHIVGIIISATRLPAAQQAAKDQLQQSGTSTNGVDVNGILGATLVASIVIGVLYIIAFIVFDLFMRRGANWARIVLLIVTILGLTGVIGGSGVGAVGVLASVVAAVLTFLPASNAWFRAVKDRKRGAIQN